jgi:RimJ/RimL family protein N-acetyltransferase
VQPLHVQLPVEVVGERVRLRPYREGDGAALWEAVDESREHLSRWMPWVHEYGSPADAEAFARRAQAKWLVREDLVVGIFERDGPRLLGGSGLHRIDWSLRSFEIGYWIRATAESRGYVSEAVQLLTSLAFEQLEAHRVEIRIDPRNTRSRAVAERTGFVLEGCLRSCVMDSDGQPADRLVFSMTRQDYAPGRARRPVSR